MGFVDFLVLFQRRDASRQFFEARAAGVNVRHGSVHDDRIDLRVSIERRSVLYHVAIQGADPVVTKRVIPSPSFWGRQNLLSAPLSGTLADLNLDCYMVQN